MEPGGGGTIFPNAMLGLPAFAAAGLDRLGLRLGCRLALGDPRRLLAMLEPMELLGVSPPAHFDPIITGVFGRPCTLQMAQKHSTFIQASGGSALHAAVGRFCCASACKLRAVLLLLVCIDCGRKCTCSRQARKGSVGVAGQAAAGVAEHLGDRLGYAIVLEPAGLELARGLQLEGGHSRPRKTSGD